MTDYDFRQHIGEWVGTRGGGRGKVIGCNPEAPEYSQLILQHQDGDVFTRSVHGRINPSAIGADMLDLVPPVREYTTRAKLWGWNGGVNVTAIPEDHWSAFEKHDGGNWISEPTEVTFKLLPGVKLP